MKALKTLLTKKLIGLDLGCSSVKAAELTLESPPRLLAYKKVALVPGTISSEGNLLSEESLIKALKKLFSSGGFSTKNVAVNLLNFSAITHSWKVPPQFDSFSKKEALEIIRKISPFPTEEVSFDYQLFQSPSKSSSKELSRDVLIVLAKKQSIRKIKSVLSQVGIDPLVVDNQSLAVGNNFFFNYPTLIAEPKGRFLLLDFGAGSTKIVLCEMEKIIFSDEIKTAGNVCTKMIAANLGISFEEAEKIKVRNPQKSPIGNFLGSFARELSQEIWEVVLQHLDSESHFNLKEVFICGGGSQLLGLKDALSKQFGLPVHSINPLKHVVGTGEHVGLPLIRDALVFATVAVGLAFRRPNDKNLQVNLSRTAFS